MYGLVGNQSLRMCMCTNQHRNATALNFQLCTTGTQKRWQQSGGRQSVTPCATSEEPAPQESSRKPYSNRLQSNPAYQRLKARKQLPQDTGNAADLPPPSEADTQPGSSAKAVPAISQEPTQPAPGLSHRQRDRPVRRYDNDPGRTSPTSPSALAPSQKPQSKSETELSAQTQSPTSPTQGAVRPARPSLQPLSAIQQKPYPPDSSQAPVRHADFAEGQQGKETAATVQFWLTFHAEFGQRLRVVGSHKNLGSWIMVDGPELKWTEGDRWHAKITLPSGTVYEYKYVVLDSSGTHALNWQRGNNSVLAIKQDEPELEVFDNWEGQPGAAVMAGGKSSTRESKLLAWATDIESQLGLQRQELRRSRVELASAQEDARSARQEARAVRMELAQSQSIRAQADRLVRELQSSNRLLKSELQATTTTFKQALHAAETMLVTAEQREQDIPEKLRQEADSAADSTSVHTDTGHPASDTQGTAASSNSIAPHGIKAHSPLSQQQESVESPGDDHPTGGVTASGMQGQVAESATSSNARQQSTSTVASARPSSASKPGTAASNTQAGQKSSSSRGFSDSSPSSATPSAGSAPRDGPVPSTSPSPVAAKGEFASQPQMADLPKHGKPNPESVTAAPPKAPGTFADSDLPSKPDQTPSEEEGTGAGAGQQLETARTAVPVDAQASNAAASHVQSSESEVSTNPDHPPAEDQSAGKLLETARTAVPDAAQDSNAATAQTASLLPGSKVSSKTEQTITETPAEDQSAGKLLETAGTAVPVSTQDSKAAASQASSSSSDDGSPQDQSSGKQLEAARTAVPEGTETSNAAAAQAAATHEGKNAVESGSDATGGQSAGQEAAAGSQATPVSGNNSASRGENSKSAVPAVPAQSNGNSSDLLKSQRLQHRLH